MREEKGRESCSDCGSLGFGVGNCCGKERRGMTLVGRGKEEHVVGLKYYKKIKIGDVKEKKF